MKLHILALLPVLQLAAAAHNSPARRAVHRRQQPGGTNTVTSSTPPAASSSSSTSLAVTSTSISTTHTTSAAPLATPSGAPVNATPAISQPGASSITRASSTSINTGPPPAATGTEIPPIEGITSGMPTKATLLPTNIYTAGAQPPVSGAPPLPTPFVFTLGEWPVQDKVPPTDSTEVQTWMKELDGFDIPDFSPTVDGSCGGDPAAAAEAATRGWWTCGGHVRDTDITHCPDKNTWGVSFDDGPSGYTQYLLNYLDQVNLAATFFVVGSRVIERPSVLIEEYMQGHEISAHTWSHRPLTSLTTEQVVAELGWTRRAIKRVLGITPTTMRPPFGDIDDRVRAISLAMGMVPIMWTRTPSNGVFDTEDWRVAAGYVNGSESFKTFQTILNNATTAMETGFIVLEHDLYEVTVDLAVGFTLPFAASYNPKLTLQPIGQCIKKPTSDLYLESNTNKTFPAARSTGISVDGDGIVDTKSGDGGKTAEANRETPHSAATMSFYIPAAYSVAVSLVLGAVAFF